MRRVAFCWVVLSCSLSMVASAQGATAESPSPVGAQAPRQIAGISLQAGVDTEGTLRLVGTDSAAQMVVIGDVSGGGRVDLTREVEYEAAPAGIVSVSPTGWVTPQADGSCTLTTRAANGQTATVAIRVSHFVEDVPVNFPNSVVPVFTKYGCNGGGCHGKSGGQNGFRLSLLGFEPQEDYEHLVKEARGRRLFPAAPRQSMLLQKATGEMPHGGGARIEIDSPPYRAVLRWVEQGMPYGNPDDPTVERIEVLPRERILSRGEEQQIIVLAHYSDGSIQDVTRTAQYESGETELAEVSETGLVTAGESAGSVAVMARYQAQVDVFRAMVPLGAPLGEFPLVKNYVDELIFAKLKELGMPPSQVCDDSTFIRRVTLDIAGRLPRREESLEFLADSDPAKRDRLVDRLLDTSEYADYFANKWSAILRNRRKGGKYTTYAFHAWIREGLMQNKPYDRFVHELLAARGQIERNPAVAWYHHVRDQSSQVEDAAQLFLGLRIQCARCHHHPFEKWSQQDYYGLSAYFSRIGRKPSQTSGGLERIYHKTGVASATNPKTQKSVPPTPLGGDPFTGSAEDDPRQHLAAWMASPDNPFFSRALVNRYWKHFFSRGLVEPEDDMRVTNPATHPKLLDTLAARFVESGFDMKQLIRTICTSQVYSLSAIPNEYNLGDKQSYSRFYPRRLNAEVLLDSIDTVAGSQSKFAGMPAGTRAVELPDNAFNSYFLTVFGRPEGASACECERSGDVNLAQCLHLLNSDDIRGKLASDRVKQLASQTRPHRDRLRDLYLIAYSREPEEDELVIALAHIEKNGENTQAAYEDLLWVLINTKEFLFNH